MTPEQADGSVPTHRITPLPANAHPRLSLSTGAAVAVTGRWASSPGTEQSFEIQADSVRLLGSNDATVSALGACGHVTGSN